MDNPFLFETHDKTVINDIHSTYKTVGTKIKHY